MHPIYYATLIAARIPLNKLRINGPVYRRLIPEQYRELAFDIAGLIIMIAALTIWYIDSSMISKNKKNRAKILQTLLQDYPEVKLQLINQYEAGAVFYCYQQGFPHRIIFVTNYHDGQALCDGDIISTNISISHQAYDYTLEDGKPIRIRGAEIININQVLDTKEPKYEALLSKKHKLVISLGCAIYILFLFS